ncbi:hypothetical protein L6164_001858 [Bauhinia variegata]|uniref:Uncharacterized protein n=1 Tax=Bauhinia variegata TaxID=167791 RepID=A0ACB9QA32_BAUVA|nr:hypothetical protein L6164_001858 [Bauhinia variegata]
MDSYSDKAQGDLYAADAAFEKLHSLEGFATSKNDTQELESSLQVLTEVDFRLAYSSEKLVNLHASYIYLLAQENDLDAMDLENDCISIEYIEKALTFDLLSSILDSEVRELDNFMDTLQEEMVDARHAIFSCRHLTGVFPMIEEKLQDSEESVKQFQQQFLEFKMQSSKLLRTNEAFQRENWEMGKALNLSENSQLLDRKAKSNNQMVEQQRYILRLLEKSLARELELEKKLAECRKNEELKLKLHYTEQVAFHMEEASGVVWGRFLEAENAAEVLMGISKQLMGRLQIAEFNVNGYIQRENELKSKYQNCIEQLHAKESAIEKLERYIAEHVKENGELSNLREKVKLLEEQKEVQLQLNAANAENETSQEQLIEMGNLVESLRESLYVAETRADSAEAKVAHLTETNLELTEELNFHKNSASNAEKKVGSLEKQVRESEIQLQNAKASSEASQEQQNMLYSAIWDMETLIEDLKSKVAKAESRTETVEEQCIVLSETNFELNKELDLLRSRTKSLKTSLDQAKNLRLSGVKEINIRTKSIMGMVKQLAIERERIQEQLCTLRKENRSLVEKLNNTKAGTHLDHCDNGLHSSNEDLASNIDSSNGSCTKAADEEAREPLNRNFEVGEPSEDSSSETQTESSISANKSAKCSNITFLSMAVIFAVVSVLAMLLVDTETFSLQRTFDG